MTQSQFIDRLKQIGFIKDLNSNDYLMISKPDYGSTSIKLLFSINNTETIVFTGLVKDARLGINLLSVFDLKWDFVDPTVPINRFSEEMKYSLNEMFYAVDIMLKDTRAYKHRIEPLDTKIILTES